MTASTTEHNAARRLDRTRDDAPSAPVRIVHLGVGNFFRAHQAWYTQRANSAITDPEDRWGIAAFTGRSPAVARDLAPSQGLYTLATKGLERTEYETVEALAAVHAADDNDAWCAYLADPRVAIVTSTVTEAGYRRAADGSLDRSDPQVAADIEALRATVEAPQRAGLSTAPGRLVAGLLARRGAARDADQGAPLAIVPCDNVPENGPMVRRVVLDLAGAVDPEGGSWIEEHVSFVTTMVDRITPRTTDADRAALAEQEGIDDPALVVTEPFAEWVLAGDFPGGRPAWEEAGARFVDDVAPFETRKLWLLNGSHSLMAYAATILGHETVAQAIGDERVRGWVEQWWDVAAAHLSLPAQEIEDYRAALIARYENPNIRHLLAQIAADGSQKIPIRIVPALRTQRTAGGDVQGATRAIAAWILHLRGLGAPVTDTQADRVVPLAEGPLEQAVARVLHHLDLTDARLADLVLTQARELQSYARGRT